MKKLTGLILMLLITAIAVFAQRPLGVKPTVTGGVVPYEQAAYDVLKYESDMKVDPAAKSI